MTAGTSRNLFDIEIQVRCNPYSVYKWDLTDISQVLIPLCSV